MLIEFRQVDHGGGRGCRIHGDIAAAGLRGTGRWKNLHADRSPILTGGVADEHGKIRTLRWQRAAWFIEPPLEPPSAPHAASTGAGETDRQQS